LLVLEFCYDVNYNKLKSIFISGTI